MTEVRVSRGIDARPGIVWSIVTDVDHAPQVYSSVEAVERLAGEGFEVGTRWRETRRLHGRRSTAELEVTELRPGRSFTTEATQSGMQYRTTVEVASGPGATSTVTFRFAAEPRSTRARLIAGALAPLTRRSTRRLLVADLDDVAIAASTAA